MQISCVCFYNLCTFFLLETSSHRCKKPAIVAIVVFILIAVVAAALVIISYVRPTTHVPDAISNITVYPTQSNVVLLLGSFNKSEYASFDIRSNFSNHESKASGTVWVVPNINPQQYHYNKLENIQQNPTSSYYYVLADSIFYITLSHLTGPTGASAVVEFIDYHGSEEGTVLLTKEVDLPTVGDTMTVSYVAKKNGYIQYQILSKGVNGTINYNFYIYELDINSTLEQAHCSCSCTLNHKTHFCERESPYDTNFVVLHMENLKNIDIFPGINVTIFGEDKHILPNNDILGGASIALLVICIVACFCIGLWLVGKRNTSQQHHG